MREKEVATRLVLVRHGETNYPVDRIYCDEREDPSLSEMGVAQATFAAEFLADGCNPSAIYSSPSTRTRQTAEIIAERFSLSSSVLAEPALRERSFGEWEGLWFHEIEADFPDKYLEWKSNQAQYKPEGGESIYDVVDRLTPFVERVVTDNKGKCAILVAHVGPIRALVANAIGLPLERYRQLQIDPASVSVIDYGRRQQNLMLLNYTGSFFGSRYSLTGTY